MRRLLGLVAICVLAFGLGGVEGGQAQTPAATPTVVTVKIGDLELTVVDAEFDFSYRSIYQETPPAAHGVYILLTVKVMNIGSSPIDAFPLTYGESPYDEITLRDRQNRTFSLDSISMEYIESFQKLPNKLQPGLSYQVYLSFDVPIDTLSDLSLVVGQTVIPLDLQLSLSPPATATATR